MLENKINEAKKGEGARHSRGREVQKKPLSLERSGAASLHPLPAPKMSSAFGSGRRPSLTSRVPNQAERGRKAPCGRERDGAAFLAEVVLSAVSLFVFVTTEVTRIYKEIRRKDGRNPTSLPEPTPSPLGCWRQGSPQRLRDKVWVARPFSTSNGAPAAWARQWPSICPAARLPLSGGVGGFSSPEPKTGLWPLMPGLLGGAWRGGPAPPAGLTL